MFVYSQKTVLCMCPNEQETGWRDSTKEEGVKSGVNRIGGREGRKELQRV